MGGRTKYGLLISRPFFKNREASDPDEVWGMDRRRLREPYQGLFLLAGFIQRVPPAQRRADFSQRPQSYRKEDDVNPPINHLTG